MAHSNDPRALPLMGGLPLRLRKNTDFADHEPISKLSDYREGPARLTRSKPSPLLVGDHNRLRSPTASSITTACSLADSATSMSFSTVASPISSVFPTDSPDLLPPKRISNHRHNGSSGTCSTLVNEEEDFPDWRSRTPYNKISMISSDSVQKDTRLLHNWTWEGAKAATAKQVDEEVIDIDPAPETPLPAENDEASDEVSDTESTRSDDSVAEEAEAVLDFTLQLAYGLELTNAPAGAHELAGKFVRDLGPLIWKASPAMQQAGNNGPMSTTSASNSGTPAQGGGPSRQTGKRKKQNSGGEPGGDDGDECSDGDERAMVSVKRPRPSPKDEENLRLSCPFRKRNPQRFNVRDHHSCAMTYFPKFAELRQHIVKQHKRDDPSAFVCGRCNRDFGTRKELRDHQRLPREQMCEISDHDAESGIDASTSVKLLSRKRASGTSVEVQWKEVWNIVFPDDDDSRIPAHHFTPVIEHFELSDAYLAAFSSLHSSLLGAMSNPATLETLATKFHQCFVESFDRCIYEAQSKPYTNRSSKRTSDQPSTAMSSVPRQRVSKELAPRPDSGVVITDEISEESGSVAGSNSNRGSAQSLGTRSSYPNLVPTSVTSAAMASTAASSMTLSSGPLAPVENIQDWAASGYAYPIQEFPVETDMGMPHGQDWTSFYNVNSDGAAGYETDFSRFL